MLKIHYEPEMETSRGGSGAVWCLRLKGRSLGRFYKQTDAVQHGLQFGTSIWVYDSLGKTRIVIAKEPVYTNK